MRFFCVPVKRRDGSLCRRAACVALHSFTRKKVFSWGLRWSVVFELAGSGYLHCAPRRRNDLQTGEGDSRNGWGSWSSSPQHRDVEDQGTCYWLGSGLGGGSLFRAGAWAVELAA